MAGRLIPNYSLAPSFPRRRESSEINTPQSGQNPGFVSLHEDYSSNWIPAFAGMTLFRFGERHWLNLGGVLLLAFHAAPAFAEELPDPTRPPAIISAPVVAPAGGAAANQQGGLQSIIISKNRRTAIIGGETVELGGKYGDAKLIEVNEGGVVLRNAQGRQVLSLFPDVKITAAKVATGNEYQKVKTKSQSPKGKKQSARHKADQAAAGEKK